MEKNKLLIGKEVSIYFDDGSKITRKDGIVVDFSDNSIVFKSISGKTEIIPFSRIIRIEEKLFHGGN